MAERIEQQLGFDVSDALTAIDAVDKAFDKFNKSLLTNKNVLSDYSKNTTKELDKLKAAAGKAQAAMKKGGKVKADVSEIRSAVPTLKEFTRAIQKYVGKLPEEAGRKYRRALKSNVVATAEFARRNKMSLTDVKKAWQNFNRNLSGTHRKLADQMQKSSDAVKRGMNSMKTSTNGLVVSWKTMLRIVTTQMIVRALSTIRTIMAEGIRTAIDYGLRIGEIGTIAGGALGNIDKMSSAVKELSREFGTPAAETAEGLYQTLSNQVGNAAESMHVFRQASKLGIATSATTAEAVSLLTAALNGFGLSANHAERVSGILFKTVEKGRLRVSDLANIFGRTAPLFQQMGGSIEEMSAMLATMTVTGVKADTAITQLRAIMLKLIKPSEDLTKLMKDKLGVDNALQAVQKFGGVLPLLQELDKLTGQDVTAMAELFDRVRAIAGVLGVTATNAERAKENLRAMREEGPLALRAAFEQMEATPARDAVKAFNDLKVTILSLGQAILPILTALTQALNYLTQSAKQVAIALVGLGTVGVATFFAIKAGAFSAIPAIVSMKVALAGVMSILTIALPLVIAFAAGWALGEFVGNNIYEQIVDPVAAATKNLRALEAQTAKSIAADQEFWRMRAANAGAYYKEAEAKRVAATLGFISELKMQNQAEIDSVHTRRKIVENITKNMLDRVVAARQNVISKIEDWQLNTDKRQQGYRDKIAVQETARDDRKFQIRLGYMDKERQIRSVLGRANAARDKTRVRSAITYSRILDKQTNQFKWIKKHDTQITKSTLDKKDNELKAALALTKQAQQLARQVGDKGLLRRAEQQELDIMKEQEGVTERRLSLESDMAAKIEQQRIAQRGLLAQDIESIKIIRDALSLTTDGGKQKTEEQVTKGMKRAFDELDAMGERAKNNPDLKLGNMLGIGELSRELLRFQKKDVPEIKGIVEINTEESISRLRSSFENVLTPAMKEAFEKMFKEMTDQDLEWNTLDFLPQIADIVSDYEKWTAEVAAALVEAQAERREQMRTVLDAAEKGIGGLEDVAEVEAPTDAAKAYKEAVDLALTKLKALNKEAQQSSRFFDTSRGVTQIDFLRIAIEDAQEKLVALEKTQPPESRFSGLVRNIVGTPTEQQELTHLLDNVQKIQSIGAEATALGADAAMAGVTDASNALKAALAGLSTATLNQADTNTKIGAAVTVTGQWRDVTDAVANNLARAANEAERAARAGPPGSGATAKAMGGLITQYYAAGGFASKGTDTIPAMLSPGEFVMNARSTRKFYSQLVAMNSGKQPIYRSEGGPVTNVGDIHISVAGGTSDRESARNIVTRVRRELRRGSSTLG